MKHEHRMMVFSCSASIAFAEKVVEHLKAIEGLSYEDIHLGELTSRKVSGEQRCT